MADVGDVHHVQDAIAVPLQHALQQVFEQECPVIADVLVVVDGRAAGVQAYGALSRERRERAQAARVVVVEKERHAGSCGQMTRTMMKSSITKPLPIGKSPHSRITK